MSYIFIDYQENNIEFNDLKQFQKCTIELDCNNCSYNKCSKNTEYIFNNNKYVILRINNFNERAQRNRKKLNFNEIFNLSETLFEIISAVKFIGNDYKCGHYTCLKKLNNNWYELNDRLASITEISTNLNDYQYVLLKKICNNTQLITRDRSISIFDDSTLLKDFSDNVTVVNQFNINITLYDLKTLDKCNWLNDQIINFYFSLIADSFPIEKDNSVFSFNSFFYSNNLFRNNLFNFESVKNWTRNVDLFAFKKIIIPIHLNNNHWTLAVFKNLLNFW